MSQQKPSDTVYKNKKLKKKNPLQVKRKPSPTFLDRTGPAVHYYPPEARLELKDYYGGSSVQLVDASGGKGPKMSVYQESTVPLDHPDFADVAAAQAQANE